MVGASRFTIGAYTAPGGGDLEGWVSYCPAINHLDAWTPRRLTGLCFHSTDDVGARTRSSRIPCARLGSAGLAANCVAQSGATGPVVPNTGSLARVGRRFPERAVAPDWTG